MIDAPPFAVEWALDDAEVYNSTAYRSLAVYHRTRECMNLPDGGQGVEVVPKAAVLDHQRACTTETCYGEHVTNYNEIRCPHCGVAVKQLPRHLRHDCPGGGEA